MAYRIRVATMEQLQEIAARAQAGTGEILARAGTASLQAAPGGLGTIVGRGGSGGRLGSTGGLTLIKHAASFTIPEFTTRTSATRQGYAVQHYAEVCRTTSVDAVHECYYPGPGDHARPGMTQRIDGTVYTHYWRVSAEMSELIRRGEEEHLADAQRAYDLTYGLVADTINSMVGRRFGPARTPRDAERLAEAELERRLPRELGANPRDWIAALDRLLDQTLERDRSGWHSVDTNPPQTEGQKIVHVVSTTGTTRIGQVTSSQVVRY
jgi:hypothetical protein